MGFYAGIDVGSSATKAVLLDAEGAEVARAVTHSGADFAGAARTVFDEVLAEAGAAAGAVEAVLSTGYGRSNVPFAGLRRTEIECHARGAYHHVPRAITVVDIGGQDNKIIRLDAQGRRVKFNMNRKCAAGTGSFLEEMALRLHVPLGDLSSMAKRATDHSVKLGSYCTVFAMTEILAKVRAGVRAEDLARAALVSVATRVLETQAVVTEVVATGGVVAHNPLMKEILSEILATEVHLPPYPQYIGALGAALIAAESARKE